MAFGSTTFQGIGGAVTDILQGQASARSLRLKASGDRAEAENYDLASALAGQNADFTRQSTDVKTTQAQRQEYLALGQTSADVAGAGFQMSGTGLDLMRMGAQQAALSKAVLSQQGLITEAGYKEQQTAYTKMAAAARYAASEEDALASDATRNGWITGGIKGAAAIASLFT